MIAEEIGHVRARDENENVETTPPAAEELRLRAVWVAECYPRSELEGIIRRLRSIGPKQPDPLSQVAGAVKTLDGCRTGPYRGGSSGSMIFIPRGSEVFRYAEAVELDLPPSVEWVTGWIDAEVATLPVFILEFHLREDAMRAVEKALRATYTTYAERKGRWTMFQGPSNQKQAAVVAARSRAITELTQWTGATFPGFFAGGALNGSFPLLEFWTTEVATPFVEPPRDKGQAGKRVLFDYMELLRWDRPWRSWRSKRLPEIVLNQVDHFNQSESAAESYALELVGRTADLFDQDPLSASGGRTNEGFVNELHHHAVDLLSRWALRCALRGYEIQFAAIRGQLHAASDRRAREMRRANSLIQTELRLLELRADIEPVLAYLRSAAEHSRSRKSDPEDFMPSLPLRDTEEQRGWRRDNTDATDWFAERLERTVAELTDVSTAIIGTFTARVNLRLQGHVRILALLAAIIAGVTLYLQLRG